MDVAVVVAFPAKAPDVSAVFGQVAQVLDPIPDQRWSFIAVIQGDDAAWRRAGLWAAEHPEARAVRGGLAEGVALALDGFDVVVTMNASADDPGALPDLIDAAGTADVVVATAPGHRLPGGTNGLLLGMLTGGRINQPSSSYRAFRAEAARQLRFDETPAGVLAQANDLGFDIAATSSLRSGAGTGAAETGWSVWKQHWRAREARAVVWLILLGVAVFFLWSYPVQRYHIDSDGVLAGMCGTDVLNGRQWAFFPGGYRLGSGSCYLSAAVISLFGTSRAAYQIVTLVYAGAFLLFLYLALHAALGRSAAIAGLIIAAFPPRQYFFFMTPPTPYVEMMAAIGLSLWLGFVFLFQPQLRSGKLAFAFGLSLGYAFWVSPESLMVTFPLALFVLLARRLSFPRDWLLAAAGGAVGLSAYILLTLTRGALFLGEFAAQPAKGWKQFSENFEYLITFVLPLFLFDTAGSVKGWSPVQGLALLLLLVAVAATSRIAWRFVRARGSERLDRRGLTALFTAAVVVTCLVLFAESGAGGIRGWTTRYIAPIFVAVPLMAATLYAASRRSGMHMLVVACTVALAILNSVDYRVFAHPDRVTMRQSHLDGQNSWTWLHERNRDVVMGDYWLVYRLNYGYGSGITFLPSPMFFDYLFLKERLPAGKPVRLALMGTDAAEVAAWAGRAGLTGRVEPVPGGFAFVVNGEVDPKRLDAIASVRG
jgi:hypothetical protein